MSKQRLTTFRKTCDLPAVREHTEAEKLRKQAIKDRKAKMIAITKVEDYYSIGNTETSERGEYTPEGKHLRGVKVLDEEEAAYRIWVQQQGGGSETKLRKLRKMWKQRNLNLEKYHD